ncbi:hypothetical protein FB45DRAFT_300197 [Roridomyces roridus]|uniref:F-box domain-containing protein n=1 Tax=Roridomyces roridus TaxID=1738132 RepID=A0AAD7CCA3_9AGAR|nr:hypothetical protein FB45DRAFT_300197 [Roridomyces roridus]
MPFHHFNEYVVAEILAYCDIHTVLSFTQLNKSSRQSALSKQLWIILVRQLKLRGFLDADPSVQLDTHSTQELIGLVKSIILGPKTWCPGTVPQLKRQVLVRFEKQLGQQVSALLLPGGRYFTLCDSGWEGLAIREVPTGRCIWRYSHRVSACCKTYALMKLNTPSSFPTLLRGDPRNLGEDVVRSEVFSYLFVPPRESNAENFQPEPTLRLLSSYAAAPTTQISTDLTYSGYGFDMAFGSTSFVDVRLERDGVRCTKGRRLLNLRRSSLEVPLGMYSAATMELGEEGMVVSYFV